MRYESDKEALRNISPSQIRIPTELKEKLMASAKSNNRSFSAEVVDRLEQSYKVGSDITKDDIDHALHSMRGILALAGIDYKDVKKDKE